MTDWLKEFNAHSKTNTKLARLVGIIQGYTGEYSDMDNVYKKRLLESLVNILSEDATDTQKEWIEECNKTLKNIK